MLTRLLETICAVGFQVVRRRGSQQVRIRVLGDLLFMVNFVLVADKS